ncbi:SAP domain-containing protein [Candidatus Poseidoniales archaeon]|nr:SAP domain-containing protein [Candidatus Poseidoniales archaeon]
MASGYEGKTVIQLKGLCREKGLPVSGTKSVLIDRLLDFDQSKSSPPPSVQLSGSTEVGDPLGNSEPAPTEMNEISCVKCGTILRVPTSYEGMISCPSCSTRQDASGKAEPSNSDSISTDAGPSKTQPVEGFTNQQKSVFMMLVGVGISLVATWLVLAEWNLWFDCAVEYTGSSAYNELGCGQNTFFPTMFKSCCLLLPLGFFLATFGYNFGQNQDVVPQVHTGAVSYDAEDGPVQGNPPIQQPAQLPVNQQGAFGKAVQSTALGLGVGMATVTAIVIGAFAMLVFLFLLLLSVS